MKIYNDNINWGNIYYLTINILFYIQIYDLADLTVTKYVYHNIITEKGLYQTLI